MFLWRCVSLCRIARRISVNIARMHFHLCQFVCRHEKENCSKQSPGNFREVLCTHLCDARRLGWTSLPLSNSKASSCKTSQIIHDALIARDDTANLLFCTCRTIEATSRRYFRIEARYIQVQGNYLAPPTSNLLTGRTRAASLRAFISTIAKTRPDLWEENLAPCARALRSGRAPACCVR